MKKAYVCVTLYHVYVSLLDIYSSVETQNSVFILNANNEQIYNEFKEIEKKLIEHGFWVNTRLRDKKKELMGIEHINNIKQYKLLIRENSEFENGFELVNFAWNNSYIYTTANYLYKKCSFATFFEESVLITKMKQEKEYKKIFHILLGGKVNFYKDKKIKEFKVKVLDSFDKYPSEWKEKLTTLDLDEMKERIDLRTKKLILNVFGVENIDLHAIFEDENIGIIYTNPFSEDLIISEDLKVKYTMEMCDYYKKYGRVILKLHPRDTSHYPVGKDVLQLSGKFPSEVLGILGNEFKFAIAIASSAVWTTNAKYQFNINDNFAEDKKFKIKPII